MQDLLQGGAGAQPQTGAGSFAGPATSPAGFLSQQQQLLARQLAQPTGLPLTRLTPLQSQQVMTAAVDGRSVTRQSSCSPQQCPQVTAAPPRSFAVPGAQHQRGCTCHQTHWGQPLRLQGSTELVRSDAAQLWWRSRARHVSPAGAGHVAGAAARAAAADDGHPARAVGRVPAADARRLRRPPCSGGVHRILSLQPAARRRGVALPTGASLGRPGATWQSSKPV